MTIQPDQNQPSREPTLDQPRSPDPDLEGVLDALGKIERRAMPPSLTQRVAQAAAQARRPGERVTEPKPRRLLFPIAAGGLAMAAAVTVIAAIGLGWFGSAPSAQDTTGDARLAAVDEFSADLDAWLDELDRSTTSTDDSWGLALNVSAFEGAELTPEDLWSVSEELVNEELVF